MKRTLLACLFCGLAAATVAIAADFWDTQEFLQWEEKDARKLLSNSPWAAEHSIPAPSAGRASAAGGVGSSGGSMGRGRVPMHTFTIMWRSATPIKQALVRLMSPNGITPEAQSFLDKEEPDYVVAIAAAKEVFGPVTRDPEKLKSFLTLEISGKATRHPDGVQLQEDPTGLSINYAFSKTNPIESGDDITVVFEMERQAEEGSKDAAKPLTIKRKFKAKDMSFKGKFDL